MSDPTTNVSRRGHITALDGLRGLAVIAVLFFHAGKLPGGFLGVDLFFALSGFLITSLLLTEVESTDRIDLLAFWARRFRRLLPAVVLLLVVVTVITTIIASVPERAATIDDGPWVQVYLANWHSIAGGAGYWASFDLPRMFGHLWSLAIEEQFYVVWPMIVALVAWRSRHVDRTVITVCVVGSALSLAQMIRLFDTDDPSRVYIGTDTRVSSVLLGALFAAAPLRTGVAKLTAQYRRAFTIIAASIVVVLAISWCFVDGPDSPWLFRGGLFVHSLLSGLLVAGCVASPDAMLSRMLGWSPLRAIGEMSYSLYLWHWPIYILLSEERVGLSGWPLIGIRIVASFVAAALSKRLVEDPIRFRAAWARGRRGVISLGAAMLALAVFWLAIPYPTTETAAFSLDQLTTATTTATTTTTTTTPAARIRPTVPADASVVANPTDTSTTTSSTTTSSTTTTSTTVALETADIFGTPQRVLVVGDSVAFDLWPGVRAALIASNLTVDSYVVPGAGLLDTKYESTAAIEQAVADFGPDLVIYQASLWDFGTVDEQRLAYQRFTDSVIQRGASLALITIPALREDQQNDELNTLGGVMAEIAEQHPEAVVVLNSDGAWGPTFDQDVNDDLVPERKPDGVHVCPSGVAMYANWLLGELAGRFTGFVPASLATWAGGAWIDDPRYATPVGICALLR